MARSTRIFIAATASFGLPPATGKDRAVARATSSAPRRDVAAAYRPGMEALGLWMKGSVDEEASTLLLR